MTYRYLGRRRRWRGVKPVKRFADFLNENADSISRNIVDFNIGKLEMELMAQELTRAIFLLIQDFLNFYRELTAKMA
jgi:hypothetical protein